MTTDTRHFKLTTSVLEWIVVASVVATSIILAALGLWVFRAGTDPTSSIPLIILSDRVTLGLVRPLAAAAALYGLASITIMVVRGR